MADQRTSPPTSQVHWCLFNAATPPIAKVLARAPMGLLFLGNGSPQCIRAVPVTVPARLQNATQRAYNATLQLTQCIVIAEA